MIRFLLTLLALLLPLTAAAGQTDAEEPGPLPAFIQTLRDLHREPAVSGSGKRANVKTDWIWQWLDNFNASNKELWSNRILINEEHFVEASPIFIYLGGEWEIGEGMITAGHWVDIAKEHNGSLVYTEHRFFGKSIPILPLSTENLKYQSVEQALADLHNIIIRLKEQQKYKNSKVVLSGGSYSATMVVWYRRLYGDDIVGGWASSAPLVAKVDFKDYMKVVGQAYAQLGGTYCYDIIDNATSYYEQLFASGRGEEAKQMLNLCDEFDVTNEKDRWQIFSTIANVFASIAQTQKPGELFTQCTYLRYFDEDDATALSKFVQWRLQNPVCVSTTYNGTVNWYKWAMNHDGNDVAWLYQTCSEFGWYQSSASRAQPFGSSFPVTYNIDICHDVFSSDYSAEQVEQNVAKTNLSFGGLKPNVTNIYYTHGGLDPWHKVGAGVRQNATIIPFASHCADFDSITDFDSPAMRASKLRLAQLVREWLA